MGGLPDSAPARPADTPAFPNVYEVRPTREAKPLNGEEQKKLESELVSVREQQKQLRKPTATSTPACATRQAAGSKEDRKQDSDQTGRLRCEACRTSSRSADKTEGCGGAGQRFSPLEADQLTPRTVAKA